MLEVCVGTDLLLDPQCPSLQQIAYACSPKNEHSHEVNGPRTVYLSKLSLDRQCVIVDRAVEVVPSTVSHWGQVLSE